MLGLPSGYKPTKFLYKIKKNETKDLLDTRQDYPYDWYLGGVDSCTGDSGGPLWRNINKEGDVEAEDDLDFWNIYVQTGTVRATQIGIVSRGEGCANFNNPGIYTNIMKMYSWIKKTINKHKSSNNLCYAKKETGQDYESQDNSQRHQIVLTSV